MNNFRIFKRSHSYYIKEKYLSILKELEHLQGASNYYDTLTDNNYKNFKDLSVNIVKFREYIKSVYEHQFYSVNILENSEYLHRFIIILDIQNMKIEKFLRYFSSLHKKLLQLVSESLPHHLPAPSIGKRYSSKVLSDYLQCNTNKLYKFLLTEDEKSEIHLYWDHLDHYKLDGYSSKNFLEMNSMRFVSYSFYYHDIIWNIPTLLDREVILYAMKSQKYLDPREEVTKQCSIDLKDLEKKLKDKIETLEIKENDEDYIKSFMGVFNKETFITEVMSDVVGLKIHGKAYILSFLHETLGRFYGREFYHRADDAPLHYIKYSCYPVRDTQIVRQYTLLKLYIENTKDDDAYLNEAFKLLTYLALGEDGDGDGMLDQSKEPNEESSSDEYHSRIAYQTMMHGITGVVGNTMSNILRKIQLFPNYPDKEYSDGIFIRESTTGTSLRYIHLELWEERFESILTDKLPHKSILRKKILEKEFSDNYEMTPYTLEFQKDINKREDGDVSFGLFDHIKITKCTINFDVNKNIDALFSSDVDSMKFMYKHSLIKMMEYGEKSEDNNYTIYIMVTLKNSFDFDAMTNIDKWCKDKNENIVYYKSLGPQDIVLECFCRNKNSVWDILKSFRTDNEDDIVKTYSIVSLDKKNTNDDKLDIHALCSMSTVRDVRDVKQKFYENSLFLKMGWKSDEWDDKMLLHNCIGRKSYELNLYNISLRQLEIMEKILRENGDLSHIEYFFIDKT